MLRWRKKPREAGSRYQRSQTFQLRKGETILVTLSQLSEGGGWYWYSSQQAGLPLKNTAREPVESLQQAKDWAMAFVKKHIRTE